MVHLDSDIYDQHGRNDELNGEETASCCGRHEPSLHSEFVGAKVLPKWKFHEEDKSTTPPAFRRHVCGHRGR